MTIAVDLYEKNQFTAALLAFRQAADSGIVEAMMYLGVMYAGGRGTIRNYLLAEAWFDRAASAGDSQAMCNLGIMHY